MFACILRIFLIGCLLGLGIPIFPVLAASKVSVAVLSFEGKGGITPDEASIFTDRLRAQIFQTHQFEVMERSRMETLLKEQGFQHSMYCDTTECSVKVGKLLGVHQIVTGSVSRLGSLHTLTLRVLDVEKGRIIREEYQDCRCSIEDLFTRVTHEIVEKLVGNTDNHAIVSERPPLFEPSYRTQYLEKEKQSFIALGLNLLPFSSGYFYLDEPGWALALGGSQLLGGGVAYLSGPAHSSLMAVAGLGLAGSAYLFGLVHAPLMAQEKNLDLKLKLAIMDEIYRYPDKKQDLIQNYKLYHQQSINIPAITGLNLLPLAPAYYYFDEPIWGLTIGGIQALGGIGLILGTGMYLPGLQIGGVIVSSSAYLFGLIHAPLLAIHKNKELRKQLGLSEIQLAWTEEIPVSDSSVLHNGFYLNFAHSQLVYHFNF